MARVRRRRRPTRSVRPLSWPSETLRRSCGSSRLWYCKTSLSAIRLFSIIQGTMCFSNLSCIEAPSRLPSESAPSPTDLAPLTPEPPELDALKVTCDVCGGGRWGPSSSVAEADTCDMTELFPSCVAVLVVDGGPDAPDPLEELGARAKPSPRTCRVGGEGLRSGFRGGADFCSCSSSSDGSSSLSHQHTPIPVRTSSSIWSATPPSLSLSHPW
mmetsp:Transcript_31250/g.72811  ORF Transcript_31250/g.72811 Transcript_31250/m.72811 type:complete len:214 (-) Transcript_31250:2236-2877(-)